MTPFFTHNTGVNGVGADSVVGAEVVLSAPEAEIVVRTRIIVTLRITSSG